MQPALWRLLVSSLLNSDEQDTGQVSVHGRRATMTTQNNFSSDWLIVIFLLHLYHFFALIFTKVCGRWK